MDYMNTSVTVDQTGVRIGKFVASMNTTERSKACMHMQQINEYVNM